MTKTAKEIYEELLRKIARIVKESEEELAKLKKEE